MSIWWRLSLLIIATCDLGMGMSINNHSNHSQSSLSLILNKDTSLSKTFEHSNVAVNRLLDTSNFYPPFEHFDLNLVKRSLSKDKHLKSQKPHFTLPDASTPSSTPSFHKDETIIKSNRKRRATRQYDVPQIGKLKQRILLFFISSTDYFDQYILFYILFLSLFSHLVTWYNIKVSLFYILNEMIQC